MRRTWILAGALLLAACHSAGQYGHARSYVPLSDEATAAESAKNYDPIMVQRMPSQWKGKPVSVFGVVKSRVDGDGGAASLTLSVRTLEPRNLCETEDEDSCRVTVSDHEHAVVHALVKLRSGDDIGRYSVGPGSLLRVIGVIGDDVDPNDGTPVIRARYYRHWPRDFYLTTAARSEFRR